MPGLQDIYEDGYLDCKNAVRYLNVHPPGSPEWRAYDSGYRDGYHN